ncbi:hypothetical protein GH714_007757 [Hevea brasiliensis]|uniref:PGG domain-containing protein n=1 Tax=Hevea brasiliensis TaxID=3981 RepID=A0A6A6LIF8_HEVBR|nr:hypothetical protein GH714_007757 [Hevea brasiliensis]
MVTSSGNEEIAQLIAYHFPWLICKRNIKGDTALHIAARGGMLNTIQILVSCGKDFPSKDSSDSSSTGGHGLQRIKNVHGNTALHEAVMNRHHDVAQFLISADPQVWYYQNKEGWSPLYMAVKIGDFQIFRLLLQAPTGHSDLVNKLEGNPPAHATIIEGKIDMLEEMAKVNPELMQLKDGKRRNVLHWAAHRGNIDAVRFLSSQFPSSMFEMDNKGFLSIHIASKKGHVKNLTNGALWSVGIGRRNLDLMIHKQKRQTSKRRNSIKIEWFKERIGTFLLLQTLVATVTFAAALTVPGGYNSSEHQEKGMSTMLNKHMFRLFVICNTTAFYSSVIGIFSVLYMMISDMFLVAIVYFFSLFLFALALCMMSVAFMAAIHLGVSQVSWLGSYTLITGIISVVVMLLMFAAHSYPLGLRPRFFRYISYYFTRAVVPLLGNYAKLPLDKAKEFEHRDEMQHEGSQQVKDILALSSFFLSLMMS